MGRRGITLLEVLFSIFILAIGIISIASLIPAAKSQIRDAVSSDRAGAIGLNAQAELRNRGMLAVCRSEPWNDVNNDGVFIAADDTYTDWNGNGAFDDWPYGVVIDPLMLAANAAAPEVLSFPYQLDGSPYGVTPIMRHTPWPGFWGNVNHEPLADRVFRSADDSEWTIPEGDGQRPEPAGSRGQFSWLATVVPSDASQHPESYTVSVAVFRGRERLLPVAGVVPGERMILADLVGGGLGGGDVRLRTTGVDPDWLSVRANEWALLIGWTNGIGVPSVGTPGGTGTNAMVMRWYRIAGLGNVDSETISGTDWHIRYATLAGPDLIYRDMAGATQIGMAIDNDDDPATAPIPYDADGDASTGPTFQVVLFTSCIGVFEKVIRND